MRRPRPFALAAALLASAALATVASPAADAAAGSAGSAHALSVVSAKRGIASAVYLRSGDTGKLTAAGASWTYNWTARLPASLPGLEVVPMMRDARGTTDPIVARLAAGRRNGDYRYLLGFNEPDNPRQANLTPAQAANLWPKLQATGLTLGAPAVANPTGTWLRQFMLLAQQRHLRVDFIPLHFYARIDDPNALTRIKTQLLAVRKHYGKPIWVTEIGLVNHGSASATVKTAAAVRFVKAATSMLDQTPWVQRYAWMADNEWSSTSLHYSSLYDSRQQLTAVGLAYRK